MIESTLLLRVYHLLHQFTHARGGTLPTETKQKVDSLLADIERIREADPSFGPLAAEGYYGRVRWEVRGPNSEDQFTAWAGGELQGTFDHGAVAQLRAEHVAADLSDIEGIR